MAPESSDLTAPAPDAPVVITGAARGMGLACARRLGRTHPVVAVDVDAAGLSVAVADLHAEGVAAEAVVCDVTDADAVAAVAASLAGRAPMAAVVHAAGVSPTMGDARLMLDVDLVGTARVLDAFLPLAGRGSVAVCFASIAGQLGPLPADLQTMLADPLAEGFSDRVAAALGDDPAGAAYGVAKAGVIQLVQRQAPAWGTRGARIVSVSPGLIGDTPMGAQELEHQEVMAQMLAVTPLARLGRADEVAAVVEFCCSNAASFVTGCDIRVDGGCVAALTSGT